MKLYFSPYWNVPPSIVANEILPKMKEDKHYLKKQNMEIVREENGLPVIRQLPGDNNSLGKVKFLFPNSFNIYFHDTNAKELFAREKRTYSHGCIRLADPVKMAQYILEDTVKWSASNINKAMNAGKEKYVTVKKSCSCGNYLLHCMGR